MGDHFNWLMGAALPYFNFLVFLGLAVYFFKNPLKLKTKTKRDEYLKAVEALEVKKREVEAMNRELVELSAAIDDQVAAMEKSAKTFTETHLGHVKEDAKREIDKITKTAEVRLASEFLRLESELRSKIVLESEKNLESIISKQLDSAKSRAFSKRAIEAITG
jgi:F0F1-type ATP synthase membrane subunit b/b'